MDADTGLAVTVDADGNPVDHPGPHDDSFGHATAGGRNYPLHRAGGTITSVKVLGAGLGGKASGFLRGLGWAVEQGFDVTNLSLGTNRRDWALPFYDVCDQAYFRGCRVVTAANNVAVPASLRSIGSVTSVACNLATDPFRFHYNPEPPMEFLAPGIDVDVAWRGGTRMKGTGNSYAAPHIAGIAALIRSKHSELRPFQVKTVLWATAVNVREAPRAAGRLSHVPRPATNLGPGDGGAAPPARSSRALTANDVPL